MNEVGDRRQFLGSVGFIICFGCSFTILTRAAAQTDILIDTDPGNLSKIVETQQQWQAVVADVVFFQSWRLELRPLDYEGRPEFAQAMVQNRTQIFSARPQFLTMLIEAASVLRDERNTFLSVYNERRSRYQSFLESIGIIPDGQAGRRITSSLFIYANLFLVRFGRDALSAARRETYIWPFC